MNCLSCDNSETVTVKILTDDKSESLTFKIDPTERRIEASDYGSTFEFRIDSQSGVDLITDIIIHDDKYASNSSNIQEGQSSKNALECNANMDSVLWKVSVKEMTENLNRQFNSWLKDHDYGHRSLSIEQSFMEKYLQKAVTIYNQWLVSQSPQSCAIPSMGAQDISTKCIEEVAVPTIETEYNVPDGNCLFFSTDMPSSTSSLSRKEKFDSLNGKKSNTISIPRKRPIKIAPKPAELVEPQKVILDMNEIDLQTVLESVLEGQNQDNFASTQENVFSMEIDEKQIQREIAKEELESLKSSYRRKRRTTDGKLNDSSDVKTGFSSTSKPSPFKCKICSKNFTALNTLKHHYRSHADIKPYKCNICGSCFTWNSSLKYHLECHSGRAKYSCQYCNKAFRHSGHFKTHLRIHEDNPFACEKCGSKYKHGTSLKRHHIRCLSAHNQEVDCNTASVNETIEENMQLQRNDDELMDQASNPEPNLDRDYNQSGNRWVTVTEFLV